MTPRSISLVLTSLSALLFVTAVQAGEVSMDVRGLASDSEQSTRAGSPAANESTTELIESGKTASGSSSRNKWTLAAPDSQTLSTIGTEPATSASSSSGGASSNAIAAPVKSRNRWQFLVPGAIK